MDSSAVGDNKRESNLVAQRFRELSINEIV